MLFRPCRVVGTQLKGTYKLCMTGDGLVYWDRQKLRVQCPDFGADLVGLLKVQWQKQNGIEKSMVGEEQWETPPPPIRRSTYAWDVFPEWLVTAVLPR